MNKKVKKPLIILGISLAAAAALAAGLILTKKSDPVAVYPVSSVGDTGLWFGEEDNTMTGIITAGKEMTVTLREGLVDSVAVTEGQEVKKGDVLMTYDVSSFKLTMKSDEAKIALLESNLDKARNELAVYKVLIPSESAPEPTEHVIHHSLPTVTTLSKVDKGTTPSEGSKKTVLIYNCTPETVVTADCMKWLAKNGYSAEFRIYVDNALNASWYIEGSSEEDESKDTSAQTKKQTEKTTKAAPRARTLTAEESSSEDPEPTTTPEPTDTPEPTATPEPTDTPEPTATPEPTDTPVPTTTPTPTDTPVPTATPTPTPKPTPEVTYEDWVVGEGLTVNADGTVELDVSYPHYGLLTSCVPEESEWDEIEIIDNYEIDDLGNYAYSREELAEMVKEKGEEIKNLELDLKAAKLTYEKDKLVSADGEVKAEIDGVVEDLADLTGLETGSTVMTVRGDEKYTITVDVNELDLGKITPGTELTVQGYETGSSSPAVIESIGTEPETEAMNSGNPNSSWYPAQATLEDETAEFRVGEYCQVTAADQSGTEESAGLYLEKMYVRTDDGGSYVYANREEKLAKVYVTTGSLLWGEYIEITGGLSADDEIAFPYGTTVKEGASVIHQDYPTE